MATDISKDNLTKYELDAGFYLTNDGQWVRLYNRDMAPAVLGQWAASLPNVTELVRAKMREMKEKRQRLVNYLPGAIQEERQAVVEYKGKASMAASLGLRGVAKFFEQVANDEERHAIDLENLIRKLRSQPQ